MSDSPILRGDLSAFLFADAESVRYKGAGFTASVGGVRNKVKVGKDVVFNGFNILIESNDNEVVIGDGCRLAGNVVMKLTPGNRLYIGNGTSIGGANFICGEGTSITIGSDCMIAWGIEFRSTDSHAIFNAGTGIRINRARDIQIGNHVWIGAHCSVLKGAVIGDESVVSIRSVLNRSFGETGVVLAGVPAKIVRRGIRWERPLLG